MSDQTSPQGPDDQGRRREPHAARGAQEAPTPGAEPAAQAGPTQQPEQPEQAAAAGERPRSESSSFSSKRAAVTAPALGLRGTLLFLWRQLTSMQTALILLMLLAIRVPGSLYPQRSVNPGLTDRYLAGSRWGGSSTPWGSSGILLAVVLGDLSPAVHFPDRLHRPAHQGAPGAAALKPPRIVS